MAITETNIWTPNSSGATPQLTEYLLLSRDAMRTDGQRVDTLRLMPAAAMGYWAKWHWPWSSRTWRPMRKPFPLA